MAEQGTRGSVGRTLAAGAAAGIGAGLVSALVLALLVLVFPAGARASGTDDARMPEARLSDVDSGSLLLRTGDGAVYRRAPTLNTDVDIRVSGMVARAKVVQHFRNPGHRWLEGVYVFPLPENAAVDHLRMRIGERVIEGQIKERQQARKIYQQAKRAGRKASLLEQQRPNIFTSAVANIGPGEEVTIEIEYQQILRYDHGRFDLRFPMVVGPRYIPGSPVQRDETVSGFSGGGWARDTDVVADASRITPPVLPPSRGKANPVRLRVQLDAGFPLATVESPYHPVRLDRHGNGKVTVTLAGGAVPADRDFELTWRPERGHEPRAALFTETVGKDRYALVMVVPPADEDNAANRLPRDVIYVIDTSGSMGGASIRQARRALGLALDRLDPRDRFNVIQFNSTTQQLFDRVQPADRGHVQLAHQYVSRLRATGGTEMAPALTAALAGKEDGQRLRQVVFLTDGSVGNEAQLFNLIRTHLGDSRLFTVGIGSAPNSYFMRKAAQYGRGTYTYIGSVAEVGAKMRELFAKLEHPVMSHLSVQWPEGMQAQMWPRRLHDLYLGEPVVFAARLQGKGDGPTVLSGLRDNTHWRVQLPLGNGRAGAGIGVLWARSKIGALMDSLHDGADAASVRRQVVAVALHHHLVSKYTSLVAVDVTPSRPQGERLSRGNVPTNLPHGWQYGKVFGRLPQTATPAELNLLLGALLSLAAVGLHLRLRRRGC
jgi:Ca-activated chloride channel family protein